jgi:hypothetical protein
MHRLPLHSASDQRGAKSAAVTGAAKEKGSPSIGEISGAAGFAIGVVSAWLYVAGWTYAYHYFDSFGIRAMIEIPKENYLGRSF